MTDTIESNNKGPINRAWRWLKSLPAKLWSKIVEMGRNLKELGEDDPRRITHSCKVGLAITLVSLFYYFEPLYDGFGVSAIWAVITVIVVFEFSVGATLGKGVNRGIATLVGGSLGVGAHRLDNIFGERWEPIIISIFVFLFVAAGTFLRFFPRLKARYDYGVLIFILTFCLVSVSGYRDDEVIDMATTRLSTILIGGSTSVVICILVFPVWAGDELHNQLASNMDKLATFLEEYGAEYFKQSGSVDCEDNKAFQAYKSILTSKGSEESLVNFARWEPRHGHFRYRHPWDQYLKVGALTRQCAYKIEALNSHFTSEIQASHKIGAKIQELCIQMSKECSCALRELSLSIKSMTRSSTADSHVLNARITAENLKLFLKTGLCEDINILEIISAAALASLLIDVVSCTAKIAESTHELASLAYFKDPKKLIVTDPQIVITQVTGHHEVTMAE